MSETTSMVSLSMKIQAHAQQTTSFGIILIGDKQKSTLEHETDKNVCWKSNFKQICFEFSFFTEMWLQFQKI